MKCMLIVNLHEPDFIEETLTALAESNVRECVVYNVDGVASRHGPETEPLFFGSIKRLFTQDRNINNMITAITEEDKIEEITASLKEIKKEDRWASSFWFMPIKGYFYHKA